MKNILLQTFILLSITTYAQKIEIPDIYTNIKQEADGRLYLEKDGKKIYENTKPAEYTLKRLQGNPKGTEEGISFDFDLEALNGTLYYGFIPYGDSKHPLPVYFKRYSKITGGKAEIKIKGNLEGKYDMIAWKESGKGTIGYRVVSGEGVILYDGKVSFRGRSPFEIDLTVVEGPFVNILTDEGATISFTTNKPTKAKVKVGKSLFEDDVETTNHEIKLFGLQPNATYGYTIQYGDNAQTFSFKTAPKKGSRTAFTFAYASDSRNGQGSGERNVYGANFYIMKKIMALAKFKNVAFAQFSGDLINGYLTDSEEIDLQYANWKRAVEPFGHYFPIYKSMGNHESLTRAFGEGYGKGEYYTVDRFPFKDQSGEAIFNKNFVNPENGPESEDGASYDPNPNQTDFPSYKENVFYYIYDNIAVIVLNSNYIYAPSTGAIPHTSGGLHAYIMDRQVEWLREAVARLEKDTSIDHVFITQHTPFFPNGGHVKDDMWYSGNNSMRTYVAGKPLEKGIIERRDELLDIIVNKSSKVRAILTGDEHNYAKTKLSKATNIYPKDYKKKKVKLSRTIYQINNGAAGAPYYAQEKTPWTPQVSGFTTQNALVFFHVKGKSLEMEVLNPDTLETVDELILVK